MIRTFVAQLLGTWLAFGSVALFVRLKTPKDTGITCAYCGHRVPLKSALEGGIGAANAAMREHQASCTVHPVYKAQGELGLARSAMQSIHTAAMDAGRLPDDGKHEAHLRSALRAIQATAGRKF